MPPDPTLSVVVSTTDQPSHVLAKLAPLRQQVATLNAELLVVTGAAPSAGDVPRADDGAADLETVDLEAADVRIHHIPDGSVFDCRAAAFSLARGGVVVLTEDHCVHPPGWCARILEHFAQKPELMLLGGAVANGSTARIIDRMNYWMTFATFAPGQVTARQPSIAQMAVRAAAVAPPLRAGELENQLVPRWRALPGATVIDPHLCVRHDQSHGFRNTFAIHFHNGRAAGGFSPRRAAAAPMPVGRALKWTWHDARGHLRATRRAFAAGGHSLPSATGHMLLVLPLMLAHAMGAFVGYRHGPGRSPHRLV